eukprot:gnl/TRDRNA2_/TRDRNA2_174126_c3_seq10.p2 gnl/TRDRNA2_/TRDRNA2_174126_c3~~gnl/TRDRNA2_/TRDRNA2_174126_c3_seq10.p2  ORF type:complete len:233 (+),score=55.11 gnl/TRDRNA2_/TRDRNA2_174126_c3_seq10:844-1542(+)
MAETVCFTGAEGRQRDCYHCGQPLRLDPEVVLAAVKQDGWALEFAPPAMRARREIVLAACKKNGGALRFAPQELLRDGEIIMAAVRSDGTTLVIANREAQTFDICYAACRQTLDALQFVRPEFKDAVKEALGLNFKENMPGAARPTRMFQGDEPWDEEREKRRWLLTNTDIGKHFKTLGLSESCTPNEITKRYRDLARECHPDKNMDNVEEANMKFQDLGLAYTAIKEFLNV